MVWQDYGISLADVDACRAQLPELFEFADARHPSWLLQYAADGVAAQLREKELDALRHDANGRPVRAAAARDKIALLTRLMKILGCLLALANEQLVNSTVDDFAAAMGWGRKKGGKGGGKGGKDTDTRAIR